MPAIGCLGVPYIESFAAILPDSKIFVLTGRGALQLVLRIDVLELENFFGVRGWGRHVMDPSCLESLAFCRKSRI